MGEGITRGQMFGYGAAILAIVILGGRYLQGSAAPSAPAAAPKLTTEQPRDAGAATVHVAGAVRRPGVYRLKAGARIDDAVEEAGGPTRRADLGGVNLAAKVEDGRQVLVPERARDASAGAAPSGAAAGGGAPGQPLDLNTATLEQLDTLPGVGAVTAQKILDYRDEQGGFGSVDELGQVPGIGDKRLADLRELVRV